MILLVDDDPDWLGIVARWTRRACPDACVLLARDAREALAYLTSDPPDVVLTDVMLPLLGGGTGADVVAVARARGVPRVYAMSHHGLAPPGVRLVDKGDVERELPRLLGVGEQRGIDRFTPAAGRS